MKAHVQIKKLLRLRDESLFKENQAKGSLVEKSHVFFFQNIYVYDGNYAF